MEPVTLHKNTLFLKQTAKTIDIFLPNDIVLEVGHHVSGHGISECVVVDILEKRPHKTDPSMTFYKIEHKSILSK